jgi:uncharacterized membrane protein
LQQPLLFHALGACIERPGQQHLFVYNIGFSGQESRTEGGSFLSTFLHFTLAGYGIALLVSLYVLWTLGAPTTSQSHRLQLVLSFPAALGAAMARLVI